MKYLKIIFVFALMVLAVPQMANAQKKLIPVEPIIRIDDDVVNKEGVCYIVAIEGKIQCYCPSSSFLMVSAPNDNIVLKCEWEGLPIKLVDFIRIETRMLNVRIGLFFGKRWYEYDAEVLLLPTGKATGVFLFENPYPILGL